MGQHKRNCDSRGSLPIKSIWDHDALLSLDAERQGETEAADCYAFEGADPAHCPITITHRLAPSVVVAVHQSHGLDEQKAIRLPGKVDRGLRGGRVDEYP
jgi:hypothetical protein